MNTTYIVKHIQKGLALLPTLVAFLGGPGCGAWGVASAGELVLAERGRPAAYTIVRPAQASASEVYAAEELRAELAKHFMVDFDDAGSIGKRYRRQDEIGTPYCVTVDFDTLEDGAVTVRDRDTMQQVRLPIEKLVDFIAEKVEF